MILELNTKDKKARVEIIQQNGNYIKIKVNNKEYNLNVYKIKDEVYSFLIDNVSYNVELIPQKDNYRKYMAIVDTLSNYYEIEVIDKQTQYERSRKSNVMDEDVKEITTPMPGKVVKIPVRVGDKLKPGDTVIIIEAMKMQSEYKVKKEHTVKKILVKEGDIINGNQPLVIIE